MTPNTNTPNERLINDAMSTSSLDAFYADVEQQLVQRMEGDALPPTKKSNAAKWWGLGAGLVLVVAYFVLRPTSDVPRPTSNVVQRPTTDVQHSTSDVRRPASNIQQSAMDEGHRTKDVINNGSSAITKMTAQTQATPTLSEQTQRDIDSLRSVMDKTTVPADRARIGYQLGLRYRLAGKHTAAIEQLLSASRTAKDAGALLLAAKSTQQAAKAASQLGDRQRAIGLYNDALQTLPTAETTLRERWQQERDALQR